METTVYIPATMRPATIPELFGVNDMPLLEALYFKENNKECFSGPHYVSDHSSQENMINLYIFRKLYVIVSEGSGYDFALALRPADRDDLVAGKSLRTNLLYYVRESEDVIDGPYYFRNDSDLNLVAAQLAQNAIYVVAENQNFTPFKTQKSA